MEEMRIDLEKVSAMPPERKLIEEVILLAVTDSLGGALLCGKLISKAEAADMARKWLIDCPVCRHYCTLVDIDHQAMIDRLKPRWDIASTIS